MYGFDISNLIQATIGSEIYWSTLFRIITDATCGWLYSVNLNVRYGTNSAPAPDVTDHIVIIKEGQLLHCNAELEGIYWLNHPVTCKIKDSLGNVVFTKTKWLTAGVATETDFFRNVSLPKGSYTVDWVVCGKHALHNLTVSALPQDYVTNYIDIEIVVTDTEGINAQAAWDAIKAKVISEMLVYDAIVEFEYAEVKGRYFVIFHLKVTGPPEKGVGSIGIIGISYIIIAALLVTFAYLLVAVPAIEKRKIAEFAYNLSMKKYTYEDCVSLFYNEWVACMAAKYPAVWAEIKDKITPPPSPPPPTPDWMDYITYGVVAIFSLVGLYIGVKYILPAIKK